MTNLLHRLDQSRRWRIAILAVLAGFLLLRIPFAASHMDLARDMFVAWRLLHGEEFPLQGPTLAGVIHLGPAWYYLLAVLQAIGQNWFGTIFLLGLLASLQIPLAYLLGKELHSRRAGFLWAIGLLVPCWSTYDWMLPLHPILSPLLILGFLLCCLRYWRGGARRYFYGMALAFGLALHAHPANAGLAWIGLFVVLRATHPRMKWQHFVLAVLLAILPLLPFLYAEATQGFPDLHRSAEYLAYPNAIGNPDRLPSLLFAIVYGGTRYLFDPMMGWSDRAAQMAASMIAIGGIAGAAGLIGALRKREPRRMILLSSGATFLVVLTVVLMRPSTPYYMTTSSHVVLAGLVALGLCYMGESVGARSVRIFAVATTLLACLLTTFGNARFEARGNWPFALWPMFDVLQSPGAVEGAVLMPAYAMKTSGDFLCAQPLPTIHGTYATLILQNYAMEMRLNCGRTDVHLGGNEAGRSHWLGVSRTLLAEIGVHPLRHVGPIGLVPARPISDSRALLSRDEPRYPAYLPELQPATPHHMSVPMRSGEHLAIANLALGFTVDPRVTVRIDGTPIEPATHGRGIALYNCGECANSETVHNAEIDVISADFADLDIVVF